MKKARILAVDDDEGTRILYETGLSRKGFDVEVARDGIEAVATLEASVPDAVVLDIGMPNASGLAVIRWLRAHEDTAALPVVTVTGLKELPEWTTDDGGWDVALSKPVDIEALAEILEKLIVGK